MMAKQAVFLVALVGIFALAACGGTPSIDLTPSPAATIESTAAEAIPTPASRFATVVAGQAITATVALTSSAVTVPAFTPTPAGTPTPTPTPSPGAALLREAGALQEGFLALRDALASGDKDAALKAQRALLEEIPRAEAAASEDQSKAAESFRAALRALKAALNGDLAKLDNVDKGIADVLGAAPMVRSTVTAGASTTTKPIASLPQYASALADSVTSFQKALEQGNVADMLRLQKSLLEDLDRGDVALKSSRAKQADLLRSALEDLRNALGGDSVKFDSAVAKLRQVAESATADGTARTQTTTGKQLDVQPLANELRNKLAALSHAVDGKNRDDIVKAQQALADQVTKAENALADDRSSRGAALRQVIGSIREAASGDTAKIAAALSALDRLMGSQ